MVPNKLQVFVSSVMAAEDLSSERSTVVRAIDSLDLTVAWAFETAPAEPDPVAEVYLREVRSSDLLVVVVSNSHSAAVQAELDEAESHSKPILAFVRRVEPAQQDGGRIEVIRWLQQRVKYMEFADAADLERVVRESIAAELIRGYRTYQLAREDFRRLVDRVEIPPGLIVRDAREDEIPAIRETLEELVAWYPEIGGWITKTLGELDGPSTGLRVADIQGDIAAVAFSRDKDSNVRKFSTLYVRTPYQGGAIGPHLVHEEVLRAARDGMRKAYVTFADELADVLAPMLQRYGFVPEGVSGGRYRPHAGEWVLGKTFFHGQLTRDEFAPALEGLLVTQLGGSVIQRLEDSLVVRVPRLDLFGFGVSRTFTLVFSTSSEPEVDYEQCRARFAPDESWVLVSMYGRPADRAHWSNELADTNWIDGYDLAARYYPVELVTPDAPALIVTIRPEFADALIPRRDRPALFPPERLQIRPDNVYYRAPDRWQTLRRGSPLVFYTSAPEKRVRGIARLTSLTVDTPEDCLARFGSMGLFQLDDLDRIAEKHQGRVLALAFDWYDETVGPSLDGLRDAVPGYTPVAAKLITCGDVSAIRDAL